jgi:hypothetical protein
MSPVPRRFPEPDTHPITGTRDDDDDPGAEHARENEARERAVSDQTEAPEEFETDDGIVGMRKIKNDLKENAIG